MDDEQDFTQAVSQAMARILEMAEEQQLAWPLHVTSTDAHGHEFIFLYPAQGETPLCLAEPPDDAVFSPPYEVAVREWDEATGQPKRRAFRARIDTRLEDEGAGQSASEGPAASEGWREGWSAPTRSSADLIAELEEENSRHFCVVMAVSFEHTTVWVLPHDPHRLKVLNDAMSVGGIPIGLLAADSRDRDDGKKQLTISTLVYPEHVHKQEEAAAYLGALAEEAGELIKRTTGAGSKNMTNDIEKFELALATLRNYADEAQYVYPLHFTITAADGQEMLMELPAKGAEPTVIENLSGAPLMPPPYTVTIRESGPDERLLEAIISGEVVNGQLDLKVEARWNP